MNITAPITIFVVEDNRLVSFAVRRSLERVSDFAIAGFAREGETAVAAINALSPDVALVDIGLPNMSGIEVTRRVKLEAPKLKVIVLTASDTIEDIVDALDAGADGYVLKEHFGQRLELAIRSVRIGAVWLDPGIAKRLLDQAVTAAPRSAHRQLGDLTEAEVTKLGVVADSSCEDGYCLVDPGFLQKVHASLANEPVET